MGPLMLNRNIDGCLQTKEMFIQTEPPCAFIDDSWGAFEVTRSMLAVLCLCRAPYDFSLHMFLIVRVDPRGREKKNAGSWRGCAGGANHGAPTRGESVRSQGYLCYFMRIFHAQLGENKPVRGQGFVVRKRCWKRKKGEKPFP